MAVVGFAVGFFWSFGSCFKQTCSETDAAAIWFVPLIGLAIGLVMSTGIVWKRAWFYAHPLFIWLPAIAIGGVIVVGALARI